LIEGVQTPEMIAKHFRNTLIHIQRRKYAAAAATEALSEAEGAEEERLNQIRGRWDEVDVVGACLKMGVGR